MASTLGLTLTIYYVSSHALTAQANEELDRIAHSTTEVLDLWLGSRRAGCHV